VKNFCECDAAILAAISVVLCDLDDTLTLNGRLPSDAYVALERLRASGRAAVIVTGRPAGWCDLIARLWPVDGVVGENGAFYFRYVGDRKQMIRRFTQSAELRRDNRVRLLQWFDEIRRVHPHVRLAADQDFRVSDLAIDICEDVEPLPREEIADLMTAMTQRGATVKLSSIHVNAWIGAFDKLTMSKLYLARELQIPEEELARRVLYIGDSPNDEPMFRFFDVSVGVQNVASYLETLEYPPSFITKSPGGLGFAEAMTLLLRQGRP
jgi:HAD superfamily hydrolase (TIGR01484 family)